MKTKFKKDFCLGLMIFTGFGAVLNVDYDWTPEIALYCFAYYTYLHDEKGVE